MIDFTHNPIIPADYKSPRERTSLRSLSLVRLFSFSRRMTMDLLRDNVRAVYRKYFLPSC